MTLPPAHRPEPPGPPADHPRFAGALGALDRGDLDALRGEIERARVLVRARVTTSDPPYEGYFHRATLLHHVAGNPVRPRFPADAVGAARLLLEVGAEVDAGCGGGPAQPGTGGGTTLGLLATGARAHQEGVTEELLDVLLTFGAAIGDVWGSLYHTVEYRPQREVAAMLRARGAEADLPGLAGLGETAAVQAVLGGAEPGDAWDRVWRRYRPTGVEGGPAAARDDAALAAATCGREETLRTLLDAGADPERFRPWGPFLITALHGAAWAGWSGTVRLLLERGARADLTDPTFAATPLAWARHCDRREVEDVFREAGVAEA